MIFFSSVSYITWHSVDCIIQIQTYLCKLISKQIGEDELVLAWHSEAGDEVENNFELEPIQNLLEA